MARDDDARTQVNLGMDDLSGSAREVRQRPFRILLAGDFSGRAWRKDPPPPALRRLDLDNLDEVLQASGAAIDVDGVRLQFHELEDFHPDRICARLELLQRVERAAVSAAPASAPVPRPSPGGGFLDQILEANEGDRPARVEDANDLAAFISRVSAGHTAPRPDPAVRQQESERVAVAGQALRSILRQPRFKALEAAWRAADMLVRGLASEGDLEIYLLDLTLPEVLANLEPLQRELARRGEWGCIAGNYTFGQSETDARVLAALAGLARALDGPFLAEGALPEDPDAAADPAWGQFRHSQAARWIGLLMPRFLLRLPYGSETSPIESFPFEEMTGSEHAAYLWGNPAFFCAYLVGQSFLRYGWELGGHLIRRADGLPQHIYREDGEAVAKPCAEILMTERDAESLLDLGLMPLASLKNDAAVLIVRFQSIAHPAAPLAGLA